MVILRPTRRLRSLLPTAVVSGRSDTALGDWYVNRIAVDRQPLLLFVSSTTLLPMLVPARDVRRLPDRLGTLVAARLRRCGIEAQIIAAEQQAMDTVSVAPTVDRSVLDIMVDFAKAVPHYVGPRRWAGEALAVAEDRLAETPCHAALSGDRVIFPNQKAPELLRGKWLANTPLQPTSGAKIVVHRSRMSGMSLGRQDNATMGTE